ncbi:protein MICRORCHIDIA [Trifolium repens]|nr:protein MICRORCHIDIA [Trifolium repens]
MSFGFSDKNSQLSIGQYGNGFKTNTMRLGADAIVFSRHLNNGILTQSIGLLSYTFFMRAHLDRIVVPMVNYEFNTSTGSLDMLNGKEHFIENLSLLLRWSPYSSETDLLKKSILIQIPRIFVLLGISRSSALNLHGRESRRNILLNDFVTLYVSTCPYSVKPQSIADDLKLVEFVKYSPQCSGHVEELYVTIGFLKDAPHVNIHAWSRCISQTSADTGPAEEMEEPVEEARITAKSLLTSYISLALTPKPKLDA